ncbi:MAG: hypothetical protein COT74_01480 [Bdellovibrionales bacterium CG10_big_fil_rev_8_21_14_0_10_45_34]|nr:MAG: hypothetical protein COT74_01480 [Bdellovibrionales bacterium CG10_big_fil_rev_8_21_14_0_10_45_34]
MKARKPKSALRQSQTIPPDLKRAIEETMSQTCPLSESDKWVADGRIFLEECSLTVGIASEGALTQRNVHFSMDFELEKSTEALPKFEAMTEFAQSVWQEILQEPSEDAISKSAWQKCNAPEGDIYYIASNMNTSLEEEANRLLLEHGIDPDSLESYH